MNWKDISTRPTMDHDVFLVLSHGNDVCDILIQQVSVFQGEIYPDRLDGIIDYEDAVHDATHWAEIPRTPNLITIE